MDLQKCKFLLELKLTVRCKYTGSFGFQTALHWCAYFCILTPFAKVMCSGSCVLDGQSVVVAPPPALCSKSKWLAVVEMSICRSASTPFTNAKIWLDSTLFKLSISALTFAFDPDLSA